ncbi:SUMF1/EgtB/PvdO family nonheme iron enzyme [Aeoliella sp. SH292]|uniref:SUMF1/EgtB/PvdO family nonheme iron enzyme n=1 Tax=Aeoliella sp. SH292 TaxID=3454464 RepID=UPI003F960497
MMKLRALFMLLVPTLMLGNVHAEETDVPGLVSERPTEGQFVETEQGFMVPYTTTIPGTDVKYTMVPVPGGEYVMKRHDKTFTVKVEPFWMGATEVTWAEYQKYMELTTAFSKFDDAGLRQVTAENEIDAITSPSKLYEPSFTFSSGDDPNQPAVSMSQYAAKQYTKWLSLMSGKFYRLPSEAEWEYACLAGSKAKYAHGDDAETLGDFAWYIDNADYELGAVGTKKPNAWGLSDMHGNAAEWVLDGFDATDTDPADGSTVSVGESIAWTEELYPRTLKGGSWQHEAEECTADSRWPSDDDEWRINDPNSPQSPWWFAGDEGQQVGFRLLRPLADATREEKERFWKPENPRILAHVNRRIDEEGRGERGVVDPELPAAIKGVE